MTTALPTVTSGTLIADWDAETLTGVNGSTQHTWPDNSGNGHTITIGSGGTDGTLVTSWVNSQPAISAGTGYRTTDAALIPTTGNMTVFVVFDTSLATITGSSVDCLVANKTSGGGNNGIALDAFNGFDTTSRRIEDDNSGVTSVAMFLDGAAPTTTYLVNTPHVASYVATGLPSSNNGTFAVGEYPGGTSFAHAGHLGRIVVYSGALSTGDRQAVEAVLKTQYGIGASTKTGTAAIAIPGVTTAAVGHKTTKGVATVAIPGVSMTSTSKRTTHGTVTVAIPAVVLTAVAELVAGTATVTIPGVVLTASGFRLRSGTAAIAIPGVALSAVGIRTRHGTATIAIPGVSMSSTSQRTVKGTATIHMLGPSIMAAQNVTVKHGTAAVTIPGVVVRAAGVATASIGLVTFWPQPDDPLPGYIRIVYLDGMESEMDFEPISGPIYWVGDDHGQVFTVTSAALEAIVAPVGVGTGTLIGTGYENGRVATVVAVVTVTIVDGQFSSEIVGLE